MNARVLATRLHALERRIGTTDEPLTTVVQYVVPAEKRWALWSI